MTESPQYTAFLKGAKIATGSKFDIRRMLGSEARRDPGFWPLIFDHSTGRQIDFDLTITDEETPKIPVGRPKLGVKAREVTLLPRHWEWLDSQPGGASSRLRLLVETAIKDVSPRQRIKDAQESCCRFLTVIAGDHPNFEEATRALYRRDREAFDRETCDWSDDIREFALELAKNSWE
jgi:hypothetical protein